MPIAVAAGTLLVAGLKLAGQSPAARPQTPAVLPTFEDVSDKAGINFRHSFGEKKLSSIMEATGSGCVWFDYNNDGWLDLYVLSGRYVEGVTKFSKPDGIDATNHLYRNNGDGTFTDVTAQAGVPGKDFGMGATAGDYDNDGWEDLYVTNYQSAILYHNNGDGTFTDASQSSGVGPKAANGLGVVTFDYNNDGWQDIFISNDAQPNHLFHNKGDGTFREVGYLAGAAVSGDGQMEAGMGVDAADTTGSGRLDLYVCHLDMQLNRFYRNMGDESFTDATLSSKVGYDTYQVSGFGTRFLDYDNDGACDLFVANGHVMDNIQLYHPDTTYAEPKQMFRNIGRGRFENVSDRLGADMQKPHVSRGAAAGDFDNDGDLDILVSSCGQRPQLLRNDGGNANHWLELFLIGTKSNRDGVGARVKVTAGDLVKYDQRKGGMSYQSAQDPRLHFGLGEHAQVDAVEIVWPSGMVSKLEKLKSDQIIAVKEGVGLVDRPFPRVQAK